MLAERYAGIKSALNGAALVAVSKRQTAGDIHALYNLGQRDFAESYVQEASEKQAQLTSLDITWHFIGQIQSNKTRQIAEYFSWVQSLDRLEIAHRLQRHCDELNRELNVCIAVNIDREPQKGGIRVDEAGEFLTALRACDRLHCRGLMVIPKPRRQYNEQFAVFQQIKAAFDQLKMQGFNLDTLSMGMSQDYSAAIEAGSTMVRIGTGLFGARSE